MPWCPKCKTEYRSGMTTCVDCGSELVDDLTNTIDYTVLCVIETEEIVKKLVKYLSYSDINSNYEFDDKELGFTVYVPVDDLKKAKKAFAAFYTVEAVQTVKQDAGSNDDMESDSIESDRMKDFDDSDSNNNLEDDWNQESDNSSDSHTVSQKMSQMMYDSGAYEKKKEKAEELKSTALTFLVFGIAGLIFVVLNIVGVMHIIGGPIAFVGMPLLFAGFILIGINSINRMKKTKREAVLEEESSKKITAFLQSVITEERLKELQDDTLSDEVNFIRIMEGLKSLVAKEFQISDEAYLDYITEEFYNNQFGDKFIDEI